MQGRDAEGAGQQWGSSGSNTASPTRRSRFEIAICVSQVSRRKISVASPTVDATTRYVPQAPLPPTSSKLRRSGIASPVRSPASTRIPNTPIRAGSVNA